MRVMLLGSPGAGKGTQAEFITQHFKIPQISTGEMLRTAVRNGSPLGLAAQQVMEAGDLVSDDIIIGLVKERIQQADCQKGFLLDGFPRTLAQAEALKTAGIKLDHVIELYVEDEAIIRRLSGRRVHPASGRIYHLDFNPPLIANQDDITHEPLIQREDDKEETVRKRLAVYHQQTEPLRHYYAQWAQTGDPLAPVFTRITGTGEVADITQAILKLLATAAVA